ncbi:MAG: hypothetical protein ACI8PQ_003048 [Planctomycetota bacterium]|jgi:hypothetical protein
MKYQNDSHESGACELFRSRLENALGAVSDPDGAVAPKLSVLGWQEHLFACEDCRRLLAKEKALEVFLEALPKVELPERLAERVLARLVAARSEVHVLSPEDALDRLLERDLVSAAPTGLSARVIASLEEERARRTELISLPQRWSWAAAALLLLSLGTWLLASWKPESTDQSEESGNFAGLSGSGLAGSGLAGSEGVDAEDMEVNPDLLASLEILENWELLLSDDVDVLIGGLASAGDAAAGFEPFGTESEEGR